MSLVNRLGGGQSANNTEFCAVDCSGGSIRNSYTFKCPIVLRNAFYDIAH